MNTCRVILLFALLAVAGASAEDDLETAVVKGRAPQVGDWVLYEWEYRLVGLPTQEHQELWTVEEVTADATLFSRKQGDTVMWTVLPRREGEIPAAWVFRLANGEAPQVGDRPAKLEAPDLSVKPLVKRPQSETKRTARVTDRRIKVEIVYKHEVGTGSRDVVEIDLDPAVPALGLKKVSASSQPIGDTEGVVGKSSSSMRAVKHGSVAGGAGALAPPPGRTDAATLAKANLRVSPFAEMKVGASATFRVTRSSSRPIGGESKHAGRVEVRVSAIEDGKATLTFTVLEGVGMVFGEEKYERQVPLTPPQALEPHRYIDALFPMFGGALGGGAKCTSANRSDVPGGEKITLKFENDTRYEATFSAASPVGFTAGELRVSNGIEKSWDEVSFSREK